MLVNWTRVFYCTVSLRRNQTWIVVPFLSFLLGLLIVCHVIMHSADFKVEKYRLPGTWTPHIDNNYRTDGRKFTSVEKCREKFESKNKTRQWFWSASYRNPCWMNDDGKLGCVPYFFVLGFPKCGTTDLFDRMKLHPGFVPPLFKEIHWITRFRFFPIEKDLDGNQIIGHVRDLQKGFQMYVRVFSPLADILSWCNDPYNISTTMEFIPVSTHAFSPSCVDTITGDFSPSTIWDADLYTQLPENNDSPVPAHTPRDFVYRMNPCAKFIVMLRNPVDRLYSDYLHFFANKSPEHFDEIVTETTHLYKQCFKRWGIKPCVHQYGIEVTGKARLRLGLYHTYISDWLEKFPRDQFLFIRLEDYSADTRSNLEDIFNFLELGPISDHLMDDMASATPTNTRHDRKYDGEAPSMLPETRKKLEDFYAPFNKKLALLLNDKRYEW